MNAEHQPQHQPQPEPSRSRALRAAREQADAARARADAARARADAAEGLAELRAASLTELAKVAEELRCLVADLHDDALGARPIPQRELRHLTGRIDHWATSLSRAARGYTGARTGDMTYPGIHADLEEHGWTRRPDRDLDGTLPPVPITELDSREHGYRCGWLRGTESLILWFTGPYALAYAKSSRYGRLVNTHRIRAVITASPDNPTNPGTGTGQGASVST